jgi:glutamyl-tRNA reductase
MGCDEGSDQAGRRNPRGSSLVQSSKPMAILALGISHRHAPVELLERMAFGDQDLEKAFRWAGDDPAIEEAVILSTCNRVEIYGSVPAYHSGFQALKRVLCGTREMQPDEIAEPLYSHYEEAAIGHVFSVAGGLDSMVLGEPQILAQVRNALRRASREGAAGPVLTSLFQAATRTGRRVRSETAVGAAPDAFVAAGAELAAEALGGLIGRTAVVVGAGQMSALAMKHLRGRGVGSIRVLNRSVERARTLAERTSSEHGALGQLPHALGDADLVISATGAAGIVISEAVLRHAIGERDRPMFVLDLAVPRDVEPSAAEIRQVSLVDIEGLRASLEVRHAAAAEEIARAHQIVSDEVRRFLVRRRSERLAPVIRALHARGDRAVAAELERFRSDLASLTPEERAAVEALARGIVAKLLHDPIVRMKERAGPGGDDAHVRQLAGLFGIDLGLPPA